MIRVNEKETYLLMDTKIAGNRTWSRKKVKDF
jgi:hypothetical protein